MEIPPVWTHVCVYIYIIFIYIYLFIYLLNYLFVYLFMYIEDTQWRYMDTMSICLDQFRLEMLVIAFVISHQD